MATPSSILPSENPIDRKQLLAGYSPWAAKSCTPLKDWQHAARTSAAWIQGLIETDQRPRSQRHLTPLYIDRTCADTHKEVVAGAWVGTR